MSFSGSQLVDVLKASQAEKITVLEVLCRHFGGCAVNCSGITFVIEERITSFRNSAAEPSLFNTQSQSDTRSIQSEL